MAADTVGDGGADDRMGHPRPSQQRMAASDVVIRPPGGRHRVGDDVRTSHLPLPQTPAPVTPHDKAGGRETVEDQQAYGDGEHGGRFCLLVGGHDAARAVPLTAATIRSTVGLQATAVAGPSWWSVIRAIVGRAAA